MGLRRMGIKGGGDIANTQEVQWPKHTLLELSQSKYEYTRKLKKTFVITSFFPTSLTAMQSPSIISKSSRWHGKTVPEYMSRLKSDPHCIICAKRNISNLQSQSHN